MQHVTKIAETLLRHGKLGAAGISGPDAISTVAQMLIPEAHARTYVSIFGGRGSLPIHTRHVSIWTLMSPHMSGESVPGNRIQTRQLLPGANLPLSASPSWVGGRLESAGVTKQTVLYIVLHVTRRVSQQLERENSNAGPMLGALALVRRRDGG